MKAIWLVRRQELAARIRFWTAIIGYDPRDHSLRNILYLVYVLIFFSIWGFAVLTLLADAGSTVLNLAGSLAPSMAAVYLLCGVLLLVACIQGYRAGVRSPFLFSEADAELICQTPVNRSQVALAWFLGDWFAGGMLYSTVAIVLRFASLQMLIPGGFTWPYLPAFILAGVQTICIVLPLHMCFFALVYALGALRLHIGSDNRWIRWVPVGAGLLLVTVVSGSMALAQVVLWPVLFLLQAAFGIVTWLPGFGAALLLAGLGLLILYLSSRGLNLSLAAQESLPSWAIHQADLLGDTGLSQRLKVRQKLGSGHVPSRIRGCEGLSSMVWKALVAATRLVGFSTVTAWIGLFGVSLAMLLASDWGTRVWAFVIWGLLVAQRGTSGLRSDLGVWTLTRQLPFSSQAMLIAECAAPAVGLILAGWSAILVSCFLGAQPSVFLIAGIPAAILCIVFCAAYDVLHHCRTGELLAGQVAGLGAGGLLLGLILGALPIAFFSWLINLVQLSGLAALVYLSALLLAAFVDYAVLSLASRAYRTLS